MDNPTELVFGVGNIIIDNRCSTIAQYSRVEQE